VRSIWGLCWLSGSGFVAVVGVAGYSQNQRVFVAVVAAVAGKLLSWKKLGKLFIKNYCKLPPGCWPKNCPKALSISKLFI